MFRNVPLTDFTVAENRARFAAALASVEKRIAAKEYRASPIIGGEVVRTSELHTREDPSDSAAAVGIVEYASVADAQRALEMLSRSLTSPASWAERSFEERAAVIDEVGRRMQARRDELSALIVHEAGKPWKEADADVVEAIDFCFYYADEIRGMAAPQRTQEVPGEDNHYLYQPRGLAVVIAPWNFPLAIACGMAVAALVCGNHTILKPAEQTSLIAAELARLLLECGVPGDAFAFLPGLGESVGRHLVSSPLVDVICFTGSKAVGLEIIRQAALVAPGQRNVKRVIAEMGGKNAVIIDEDADLDEAVKGVLYSTFGFSGQKCSACSRVIAVGRSYEAFLERFVEAVKDVISGPAADPATLIGPVIDGESRQRILKTIEGAERDHRLAFKGAARSGGYYVPAAVFRDVPPTSPLWKNEIFGPVLCVAPAKDLDEALRLALESEYALTGGFYSRSPANIARARRDFRVGNLYINRGCTGAVVCRQPFGGSRMSGVGSKAGGPDYLLQFLEPRTITENTMRRGFTPDLAGAAKK